MSPREGRPAAPGPGPPGSGAGGGYLEPLHVQGQSLEELMGRSRAVQDLAIQIRQVASSDLSVLITGETGSGKELVARAIHNGSPRAAKVFVAVDCGSLPENLIESELFGYEKGAFTGACRAKPGKFTLATEGTLFLDEISNFPHTMQAKVLRALEDRRFYPLGGTRPIGVDLRIIAASNVPLREKVAAGEFRRDLFHRLNEFEIHVPALRHRREDITHLAHRFLRLTNASLDRTVKGFSAAAREMLLNHAWPGNVRELRNVVRRAALTASDWITPEHLHGLADARPATTFPASESGGNGADDGAPLDGSRSLREMVHERVAEYERTIIVKALQQTGGNKAKAARLLRIDYKTMHTKVRVYRICAVRS